MKRTATAWNVFVHLIFDAIKEKFDNFLGV